MSNLATELAYITSHKFSTRTFQALYTGIVSFKAILIVLIALVMMKTKVIGQRPSEIIYMD